jgi:hypothetical protein
MIVKKVAQTLRERHCFCRRRKAAMYWMVADDMQRLARKFQNSRDLLVYSSEAGPFPVRSRQKILDELFDKELSSLTSELYPADPLKKEGRSAAGYSRHSVFNSTRRQGID